MRCLFVYKEEFPWDVRVEKIIDGLTGAGHEVVLVCRNLGQSPIHERFKHFTIRRLPRTWSLPAPLQRALNTALWFNPVWLLTIVRTALAFRPQIIIVRDLPLVAAGVIVGRMTSSRVVFDMAECYPEMYRSARELEDSRQPLDLIKSPWLAECYERWAVRSSDKIFVMIEESRDRLIKKGVDTKKLAIVSNTPPLSKVPPRPAAHFGQDLRIIYVGFVTRLRGLDQLIRGIRSYLSSANAQGRVVLDIVGKGDATDELKSLVETLQLSDHVHVHGWLSQADADDLVARANVGALTYRICGHWNHTIPNKIFDYMAAGLPVIATRVGPIERILMANDCGISCNEDDPTDVARCLAILTDPMTRQRLGDNGHATILRQYNWTKDEQRMLEVLTGLGQQ